jgi:hypothetical protein
MLDRNKPGSKSRLLSMLKESTQKVLTQPESLDEDSLMYADLFNSNTYRMKKEKRSETDSSLEVEDEEKEEVEEESKHIGKEGSSSKVSEIYESSDSEESVGEKISEKRRRIKRR